MKAIKLFSFVACLLASIQAWSATLIDGIYYNLGTGGATVTSGNYTGNITIPPSVFYGGTVYFVTGIYYNAFNNCYTLTSVYIPSTVTSITNNPFSGCSALTTIIVDGGNGNYSSDAGVLYNKNKTTLICCPGGKTSYVIPAGVTNIGDGAFSGCSTLTSIDVETGNNNYSSDGGVLYNKNKNTLILCPGGKKSYVIPTGVTSIGDGAFSNCKALTSVTIPVGVTNIGDGAFSGCSALTSITIPVGVKSIGTDVFNNCSGLTSVTIPNTVTTIGDWAFLGCGISSITIPESVISIGFDAFAGSNLTFIVIPNSVKSLDDYAFEACEKLTSVTIGSGVTSIGGWAFIGCSSLSSITCLVPNPATITMGNYVFDGVNVSSCILHVPASSVNLYKNAPQWKEFQISEITTGVVITTTDALQIFPNPATNNITVSGLQNNETIRLYNLNGQLLLTRKATGEKETIAVGHLPAGVYFVKTEMGKTLKLVKK